MVPMQAVVIYLAERHARKKGRPAIFLHEARDEASYISFTLVNADGRHEIHIKT